MPLVVADRVQETTNTTGTGTLTLAGPVAGFQSFSAIGDGNTTYYAIVSGTDWEVGIGTYTSSGTTLSRDTVLSSSAGAPTKISVAAGANVFCNYPAAEAIFSGGTATDLRFNPRVFSTTSTASITPDISLYDQYALTAQAAALAINAPIGTPVDGNKLIFRILDNGVARAITWDATYTPIGTNLPTTTTISKTLYVGCIYNSNNTRWDVIAVTLQA